MTNSAADLQGRILHSSRQHLKPGSAQVEQLSPLLHEKKLKAKSKYMHSIFRKKIKANTQHKTKGR
jgi:hypothetical protein